MNMKKLIFWEIGAIILCAVVCTSCRLIGLSYKDNIFAFKVISCMFALLGIANISASKPVPMFTNFILLATVSIMAFAGSCLSSCRLLLVAVIFFSAVICTMMVMVDAERAHDNMKHRWVFLTFIAESVIVFNILKYAHPFFG